MGWRSAYRRCIAYVGALKEKCANYFDGIVLAIAETEMDMRREEILKQIQRRDAT
jgi:hypothetical protein